MITPERLEELRAMPYEEYLRTPEWQATRKRILKRDRSQCQGCNAHVRILHVHHYTYERLGCEDDADLVTLCLDCHEELHRKLIDPPKLSFLHKCSIGLGVATIGTIGIEGFLQAPLPAEVGVLITAFLVAKNSPSIYGQLKGMVPSEVLAWLGKAPEEGKLSTLDVWLGRTPKLARIEEVDDVIAHMPDVRLDAQDTPDHDEWSDLEEGNATPDLIHPPAHLVGRRFDFSEVLASGFRPTADKIYLGTLRDGTAVFCPMEALCHVALAGATDAGKSSIMRLLMAQLCATRAVVLLLNPHYTGYVLKKQEDWTPFLPYLAYDPMKCKEYPVIEHFLQQTAEVLIPKRLDLYAHSLPVGRPHFIVIDELPAIVKRNPKTPDYLDTILKEGRKVGVYLISAAQDFLVKTIGGTGAVRDCYRTAYSVGGDDHTTTVLLGRVPREQALGKGVVLLRNATSELVKEARLAYVPFTDNESLYTLLGPSTYVADHTADTGGVDLVVGEKTTEDLPVASITPNIADKGRRAEDIDPKMATEIWNAGYNSKRKLMSVFGITDHQALKLMDMIGVKEK